MALRRLRPVDAFVLLLALASVGLVFYLLWADPGAADRRTVQLLEYGIIALFALEFLFGLVRHEHRVAYLVRNWYEVLALVPLTGAASGLPLYGALVVAVLLARFGRVFDRLYGDEAFFRAVARAKAVVVEWVADAVTLRVLDQTLQVLQKGAFTRNLADALEAHGDEMEEVVLEKVRNDPSMGRVKHLPFFDDAVELSSKVTRRIAIEALRDPRMAQMVREVIRANVQQIRDDVAKLESLHEAKAAA
jgi:voltage-gated potassium channel